MHIFPTKSDGINIDLYIVRPIDCCTIENKLTDLYKAKKHSEYARIVKKINFILFQAGKNLNEIYEQFFKKEYPSFFDYIAQEESLTEAFIEDINAHMFPDTALWKVRISDYEGYNVANMFDCFIWEDNDLIEILNNALERCKNEN